MIIVRFAECGHYGEFRTVDERAYGITELCTPCGRYRDVWEVWKDTWHSNCADCRYHRTHGMAKLYAERAATDHERRYPGHRVSVKFYSDSPAEARRAVAEIRHEKPAPTLPEFPPF